MKRGIKLRANYSFNKQYDLILLLGFAEENFWQISKMI